MEERFFYLTFLEPSVHYSQLWLRVYRKHRPVGCFLLTEAFPHGGGNLRNSGNSESWWNLRFRILRKLTRTRMLGQLQDSWPPPPKGSVSSKQLLGQSSMWVPASCSEKSRYAAVMNHHSCWDGLCVMPLVLSHHASIGNFNKFDGSPS